MTKTFVTLANSVRIGSHCIAGRELTGHEGQWFWGSWIRPVSQHGEGEVSTQECLCTDGTLPVSLDMVEITLLSKQDCPSQPENYIIDTSVRWRKIGTITPASLAVIEEKPPSLWAQPGTRSDRIHSSQAVGSLVPFQSLYLIRPDNLLFRIWEDMDEFKGKPRKHRRAIFNYGNVDYNLAITDPTMDSRYFRPFPALNQPHRDIVPKTPANCLLVVSLAAPFTDGYHYKVVATVLEY